MSYQTTESSVASGQPVELYDFCCGVEHWRYTSGAEAVVYQAYTYTPAIIKREDLESTDNFFKNTLQIKTSRDNAFASQFIAAPLQGLITITIYRGHGSDFITFWRGMVASVIYNSDEITIQANPKTSSFLRTGLRRRYQKMCNYPLYCAGCTVNNQSYKVAGTISSLSDLTITSGTFATKADGWFLGGMFVLGTAKRCITYHVGSTIKISSMIVGMTAGNAFTAYAGCDHTIGTCRSKFNNVLNFGGQPWIPTKNPFTGDPIA